MNILRTKSVEQSIKDTEEPEFQLRKELGPLDLIVFGIGVIVGTGIFVLTGVAAATRAGPAIALSFVVAGIACALAALCYAEFGAGSGQRLYLLVCLARRIYRLDYRVGPDS